MELVKMGLIQRRVSDISGKEAAEDAFASVVIRNHPKVEQAKRLDALPDELGALKNIADLVGGRGALPWRRHGARAACALQRLRLGHLG
jgi:hypothetical protein